MNTYRDKVVLEIGLNHLGDKKYFLKYIESIIKLKLKYATIQIREESFYFAGKDKLIPSDELIKGLNSLKKKGVLVGLAVCDHFYKKYIPSFKPDFFKILSWQANNIKFVNSLSSYKKPIYISLGMLNKKQIIILNTKLKKFRNDYRFIHTQLNYEMNDLNLEFIKFLKEVSRFEISYGHHAKNSIIPIILSTALNIDKIFIYFKVSKNKKHNDEDHAFYVKDIPKLFKEINNSLKFMGSTNKKSTKNMIENYYKNAKK